MTPVEISVIVVNYGTADLAIAAVESVLAQDHGGRAVDVHLVDNPAPAGEDAARIAAAHESRGWGARVTLHLEATNHGFGRGNNVALRALATRESPPDKVFLLNPDAEVTAGTLDTLARLLDERPDLAVAGCAIERPDGAGRVSAAFRYPTLRGEFAAGALFGPVSRALAAHATAHPPDRGSGPVDWVSGAALMARFSALRAVDFFDPDYFLYFEETDLMHRLKRAGWGIWFETGAHVIHEAGAATGLKSSRSAEGSIPGYWYDSWRLYFLKNHGRGYALATASARMAGWALHRVVRAALRRPSGAPRGFATMFWGHVIRPLLAAPPMSGPGPRNRPGNPPAAPGPTASGRKPKAPPLPRGEVDRNPDGIGFWALVREDRLTQDDGWLSQGFWALFWHRFGNWRMSVRPKLLRAPLTILYRAMYKASEIAGGIKLSYTIPVGRRVKIEHFGGMILGARAIGSDVVLRQNTTLGIASREDLDAKPTLEDGVEVGAGAVIVGDVVVGARAIVGANAVVTRSVPPGAIVGGIPARILRYREDMAPPTNGPSDGPSDGPGEGASPKAIGLEAGTGSGTRPDTGPDTGPDGTPGSAPDAAPDHVDLRQAVPEPAVPERGAADDGAAPAAPAAAPRRP